MFQTQCDLSKLRLAQDPHSKTKVNFFPPIESQSKVLIVYTMNTNFHFVHTNHKMLFCTQYTKCRFVHSKHKMLFCTLYTQNVVLCTLYTKCCFVHPKIRFLHIIFHLTYFSDAVQSPEFCNDCRLYTEQDLGSFVVKYRNLN